MAGGLQRPVLAYGGNNTSGPIDVATACNACSSATGRLDFESETFVLQEVTGALQANGKAAGSTTQQDAESGMLVVSPAVSAPVTRSVERPRGDGLDTLIAFNSNAQPDEMRFDEHLSAPLTCSQYSAIAFAENSRGEVRREGGDGLCAGALSTGGGKPGQGYPAIAYSTKLHNTASNQAGKFYEEYTTALDRSSPPPAVLYSAIAFQERGRPEGRTLEVNGDVAYALLATDGGGQANTRNIMTPTMQVRRLTPRECERLQGFPDDFTLVPYRNGMMADGPRYKMLGNSMAVPVVRWIGSRIQMVETMDERLAA